VTTLPTQALTMMNSDLVNKEAGKLAARLRAEREGLLERLSRGMELVQQRPPTDGEVARAVELHADLMAEHGVAEDEALRLCCLVFLNLNAFVYLD
jgi:predicted transcriptional regulator of viral defense system